MPLDFVPTATKGLVSDDKARGFKDLRWKIADQVTYFLAQFQLYRLRPRFRRFGEHASMLRITGMGRRREYKRVLSQRTYQPREGFSRFLGSIRGAQPPPLA
ncbi:hypothetical protein BDDG_04570 [Blastomyces dermatitidis ATCC 18188]|uniref:Uncharacterized protein n=1 Tax=Ajellomyces dermatitidis (strain ATCC 18188 / CBS 674.68) TaxID=653446 RepID=F2TEG4_AJEDA|nr:hypothetical protein BDDG_04570 [Blastomyces dermatitidis ATCC 18188]